MALPSARNMPRTAAQVRPDRYTVSPGTAYSDGAHLAAAESERRYSAFAEQIKQLRAEQRRLQRRVERLEQRARSVRIEHAPITAPTADTADVPANADGMPEVQGGDIGA